MQKLIETLQNSRVTPVAQEDRDQSITLLFLAASPLFLWFFRGGFENMIAGFGLLGMHALAFWMLSEGLRAEEAYNSAKVATRPAHPRKLYGAGILGSAIMILAFYRLGLSIWPLVFGGIASALTVYVFGLDPMRDKGMDTPEQVRTYKRKVLSRNIRDVLEQLLRDASGLGDPEIARAMREFREMAIRLLIAFENDPQNLRDLRKYLRRYLEQAVAETGDFVATYRKTPTADARASYIAALAELRADCDLTLKQYTNESDTDVDVTIDKLLERMAQESAA